MTDSTSSVPATRTSADVAANLEILVVGLESLAGSDLREAVFLRRFVQIARSATGAAAGVVWMRGEGGRLDVAAENGFGDLDEWSRRSFGPANARTVAETWAEADSRWCDPPEVDGVANGSIQAPLCVDETVVGVLQLFLPAATSGEARTGRLELVDRLCALANTALERRRSNPADPNDGDGLASLALRMQSRLTTRHVATTAVNEGRSWLDCDRVTVATFAGRRPRVEAVSGQDVVHPRADLVRKLVGLLRATRRLREPFEFDGTPDAVPANVRDALAAYVTASGARRLLIVPIFARTPDERADEVPDPRARRRSAAAPIGCLVVERFEDASPDDLAERSNELAAQTGTALANARHYERALLRPLRNALGTVRTALWRSGWFRWSVGLLFVAATIFALVLVPAAYRVEANGRLMPVDRRAVFAPSDGEVEVLVEGGERVERGRPLLRLRNDDLRSRLVLARNERDSRRQLLVALHAELDESSQRVEREHEIRIQGRIAETEAELASIDAELLSLERRAAELVVRAPMTGVVATFELRERLGGRPVGRGEMLLEIADDRGAWELDLEIDVHRLGHVQSARRASDEPLDVSFVPATAVQGTWHARLEGFGPRCEPSRTSPSIVMPARASIVDPDMPGRRIGAEVRARIDCGDRPLGYVLFGDVVDFVRRRLWL